jgi:hypothetical protein
LVSEIQPDVVAEARRLTDLAHERVLELRPIGGVAIALHASGGVPPALARSYGDIDLVSGRKAGRDTSRLLQESGYEPNERFNALNGSTRLVFHDRDNGRRVDVFVGEFRMCHVVPVADRLKVDRQTVPLAELLLTKLQIVQLNDKDLKDIWALLVEHDVADHDDDAINEAVVARVLAADWGFWRTSRESIDVARERLPSSGLGPDEQDAVSDRLERLWDRVEQEPKSLRWRSRAKLGERTRWYEEPEEIAHGG